MLKPFILPRLVSRKGTDYKLTRDKRGNRFQATFELGSLAAGATDAQAVVQDAIDDIVARIRMNVAMGKRASGKPLPERREWKWFEPYRRNLRTAHYAKIEREVLEGIWKAPRIKANRSNIFEVQAAKAFVKETKKNYKFDGKTYLPHPNNPDGNWSGLFIESMKADTVRINSKEGKCPTKVNTRITVSPKRKDYALNAKVFDLDANSEVYAGAKKYIDTISKRTIIIRSFKAKADVTAAQVESIYNRYKQMYLTLRKVQRFVQRAV